LDEKSIKSQINRYLSGKYKRSVDDFCLYQWFERCVYHGWIEMGMNLLKFIHRENYEQTYKDRIYYLSRDLQRQLREKPASSLPQKRPKSRERKNRPRGQITSRKVFRTFIIETLKELNGRGRLLTIAKIVEGKMRDILTDKDYKIRPSDGRPVWYNTMNWERFKMVEDGIIKNGTSRGIWELDERYL
jgi:hypothetical protein